MGMLLLLAVFSLVIPTASHLLTKITPSGILSQSRGTAVIIMISYGLWLFFQLKTNRAMFGPKTYKAQVSKVSRGIAIMGTEIAATGGGPVIDQIYEEPEPSLPFFGALMALLISTVLIAFNTKFATDSIQGLLQEAGLSQNFVGLVILPILSSDPTSIVMAVRDKMDISISLTLERCMQTSLMVVPLIVLLAWCMGIDDMTLEFDGFSITALFVSIIIVTYVVQEGKSNW
jgi:Ca2+:H+ antiporter